MNLIHGKHVFRVAGFNMVLSDEGAAAYLENSMGTTFPLAVDEVVSKQLFKAHTAELLPAGDYKLVVKSRAGDAGGPLQTSFRKVKYLRVVDPEPETFAITGMDSPMTESPNVKRGYPFAMHGTGFDGFDAGAGDKCEARIHGGEHGWTDMPDGDMTVSDGTTVLFDQAFWSDIGWEEMESGTEVDFRLTIGGESKVFTATVVASE